MFTNTKAQLHVSAFNVGHLQVAHEKNINKLYQRVWVRGIVLCWRKVQHKTRSRTHPTPQTMNSPRKLV